MSLTWTQGVFADGAILERWSWKWLRVREGGFEVRYVLFLIPKIPLRVQKRSMYSQILVVRDRIVFVPRASLSRTFQCKIVASGRDGTRESFFYEAKTYVELSFTSSFVGCHASVD